LLLGGVTTAPPSFAVGSFTWFGAMECGAGVSGCSVALGTLTVIAFAVLAAALVSVAVGIRLRLLARRQGLQGTLPPGWDAQAAGRSSYAVGSVWSAGVAWGLFAIAGIGGVLALLTLGFFIWSAGFAAAVLAMRSMDVRLGQAPSEATRRWALTGLWLGLFAVPCTAVAAILALWAIRP